MLGKNIGGAMALLGVVYSREVQTCKLWGHIWCDMKGCSKCDVIYVIYNLIWFMKAGGINLVLKQLILTLFSSIFMGAVCFQSWNMAATAATATYVLIIVWIGLSTRPKSSKTLHSLSCQAVLRSPFFRQSSKLGLVKDYTEYFT